MGIVVVLWHLVEWASIGPSSRRHVFCLDGEVPSTPGSRATWGGCVASCAATRGHSFGLRAFSTDKPCPCIVLYSFAGRHAEFASYPNRKKIPLSGSKLCLG